jgi:5-methylcytosine-specific restriction endonuclease McrA
MSRPITYEKVGKVCATCNSMIYIASNRADRKKYCSHACSLNKRVGKKCMGCGTVFDCMVTSHRERKFCSARCYWRSKIGMVIPREVREKLSLALLGYKQTRSHRQKNSGRNHHDWRGGITPINERLRKSVEYSAWRKQVFERDGYRCVKCFKSGSYLHADHILRFAEHPEKRLDIDNGRTLCVECHRATETYGKKKIGNGVA